jgi:predicted GNAT family acetyltransferase
MQCHLVNAVHDFSSFAMPLLLRNEAANCLMAGIVSRLATTMRSDVVFVGVTDDTGEPCAALLRTPPYLFTMTSLAPEGARTVAEFLVREGIDFPGVLGPTIDARALCNEIESRTDKTFRLERSEGVYALHHVSETPRPRGAPRPASLGDVESVAPLVSHFFGETGARHDGSPPDVAARRLVEAGTLHVWEHSGVECIANLAGETPNGRGINFVFTRPESRHRGYATALVTALSRSILASGKRFCFLFTDLANPASNAIYQRIGYRRIADFGSYSTAT